MPPRLNLRAASRSLAIRPRPSMVPHQPRITQVVARRAYATDKEQPKTPNEAPLGHVSEEAADLGKVMGETEPDIGQGTSVQEILKRDQEGKEKAPEVIKEGIETPSKNTSQTNTVAHRLALGDLENVSAEPVGHKFGLPELPLPSNANLHYRYDPVVDQVTNLLMQHGKLSVAQRNMSFILNHLRTSAPPKTNPLRPLLAGSPPASHLPLNPILYLTLAIDSVAPLLRIRSQKGAAGGGNALQIPVPLGQRQRRRTAIMWILDAASKKKSRGSGKTQFAQRVADEIISVVEGKSNVWEKRGLVHKTGTSARANLMFGQKRRRIAS